MTNTEKIMVLMVRRGNIREAELARRLKMSPQKLNYKMKQNNLDEGELIEIATVLGCSYKSCFAMNETGEIV